MNARTLRFGGASVITIGVLAVSAHQSVGVANEDVRSWESYVQAPNNPVVKPVAITRVSGTVHNPEALVTAPTTDAVTLTYVAGEPAPVLVLDYGKNIGGAASFEVQAVTGAPTLRVGYSEMLANLTANGDFANEQNPTSLRYDVFSPRAAGTLKGKGIQGAQRYAFLTLTSPGTLKLQSANFRFSGFLGTPDTLRGNFLSSDDLLNQIWYAGVYTVNLDQLPPGTPAPVGNTGPRKLLVDGAKRDRSVWSGDVMAAAPTVYAALDPEYVRDSLELLGQWPASTADNLMPALGLSLLPGPMPGVCQPSLLLPVCLTYSISYSTIFVPALAEYYRYTADKNFVSQEWASVKRVLAWNAGQLNGNGLLPTTSSNGHDWHGGGPSLSGEVTWNNVLYYMALNDAVTLADALGKPADAAKYRQQAQSLATAIDARLWNPTTGLYDISDSIRGATAQDANSFAVLSGLASPERARSIMAKLQTQLDTDRGALGYGMPAPEGLVQSISPLMSGYQIMADFKSGRVESALELMRKEWGYMLENDPGGTTWEIVPMTGALPGAYSAAHAWGSLPTAALTRYVLGVRPITPGFTEFQVAPQPGDTTWAQGTVPTPHGPIKVDWRVENDCTFTIELDVPDGTTGSVTLPRTGEAPAVVVDGEMHSHPASGDVELEGIGAGPHVISAQGTC